MEVNNHFYTSPLHCQKKNLKSSPGVMIKKKFCNPLVN